MNVSTSTSRAALGCNQRVFLKPVLAARPSLRKDAVAFSPEKNQSAGLSTEEPDRSKIENVDVGTLSRENAERRADIGKTREPTVSEAQAFDGPGPETINNRLAMLGVVTALAAEFATGMGVKEQIALAPIPILATFVTFIIATYVPISKGYTRKEKFESGIWTAKAENWNGRVAQLGFVGILLTEALSGTSVVNFWSHLF